MLPDDDVGFFFLGVVALRLLGLDPLRADFLRFAQLLTEKLQHKFVVRRLVDSEFGEALVVLLFKKKLFFLVEASHVRAYIDKLLP